MIGLLGLVLSLLLLMYLAYHGASVIILAPALAMLAVALSGEVPLLAAYTQIFMPALGKFLAKYFPLFLLGAVFGKLMEHSGCAQSISNRISSLLGPRHAILAVVLCCAVLTYGGVSLFVIVFAIHALASSVFQHANIPRRLIPGAIALGSGTFTMTSFPGSVQIQNLIPMPYFKTTAFAAPVLGTIGGLVIFALGMLWLNRRASSAALHGEGYASGGYGPSMVRASALDGGEALPPFFLAMAPIVCVLLVNFVAAELWIPNWDAAYLAEPLFGGVKIADVRGIWSSVIAMLTASSMVIAGSARCRRRLNEILKGGAADCLLPVFNVASEVGYGATVAALPAFTIIKNALLNFVPHNPLISEAAAISVLAGITGSASGGLSIALESLGSTFYQRALENGVSPEVMHRVASMASGGLDSLPHNGAVITLLTICGLTHKQSYFDIGIVTVVVPLIGMGLVIAIASF